MNKIWKWLFLGLLALNLALVSVVTYRIMTPVETTSSVSLPKGATKIGKYSMTKDCLLYTSPSPRDVEESRMPSSA